MKGAVQGDAIATASTPDRAASTVGWRLCRLMTALGVLPDAQTAKGFVDMLASHDAAWLGDMAANTSINQANIHLTGLQQSGLAYT